MTVIDYDVTTDGYYYRCPDCGASGADHTAYLNAERDGEQHDQQHDDGVI